MEKGRLRSLKISVVHPGELGPAELACWRRLHADPDLANPFLSPEFAVCVGRVRPGARVAVLEDGPDVVGFFPHERGPFRVGRPIGAGLSDCQGLVSAPGLDWDPRALLRGAGLDVWEFDHLLAGQHPFAPYHHVLRPSPVIDVSGGYDAWLEDRRRACKGTITAMGRKRRKLDREEGPVRFLFDAPNPELLDTLMRWKSAQYRRTGRSDRFARPATVRLVRELLQTREPGCTGTLSVLWAGDRPVAMHLGLRSGSMLACWFPTYDVAVARYSPGLLLHLLMAEAAADAGLRRLDLGKGDEEYKTVLGNRQHLVAEGAVERSSPVAVARRLQRAPGRAATEFVLGRPALRSTARQLLRRVGQLRSAG
jgi:CelD/BcsL family acetyltransferase involved in cellulose biosynthesis